MFKYIVELIIVFWLVRLGMRMLDGFFSTRNSMADNNIKGRNTFTNTQTNTTKSPKIDGDYVDYEEVK
jgi:hypothetical protein